MCGALLILVVQWLYSYSHLSCCYCSLPSSLLLCYSYKCTAHQLHQGTELKSCGHLRTVDSLATTPELSPPLKATAQCTPASAPPPLHAPASRVMAARRRAACHLPFTHLAASEWLMAVSQTTMAHMASMVPWPMHRGCCCTGSDLGSATGPL